MADWRLQVFRLHVLGVADGFAWPSHLGARQTKRRLVVGTFPNLTLARKDFFLVLFNAELCDGDCNEKDKKAFGLLTKTTILHVHHAFFVHFVAVTARLRREKA